MNASTDSIGMGTLNRLLKIYLEGASWVILTGLPTWHTEYRMLKKGRPARPEGATAPGAYMEVREEAERPRTQLADFFSIL